MLVDISMYGYVQLYMAIYVCMDVYVFGLAISCSNEIKAEYFAGYQFACDNVSFQIMLSIISLILLIGHDQFSSRLMNIRYERTKSPDKYQNKFGTCSQLLGKSRSSQLCIPA